MYVLNVSDCSKTKTREGIEREREKGKGGLEGKRERERGRKEERDKTLDKALLKKVGRWKAHWRILGNSVCLCCITFPVQTLWERTKIKTKRRGNKARICKEKFFTLNEKQIFEQMETFFLCFFSRCVEAPQLHKHSTERLIRISPLKNLLKYTAEKSGRDRDTGKGETQITGEVR